MMGVSLSERLIVFQAGSCFPSLVAVSLSIEMIHRTQLWVAWRKQLRWMFCLSCVSFSPWRVDVRSTGCCRGRTRPRTEQKKEIAKRIEVVKSKTYLLQSCCLQSQSQFRSRNSGCCSDRSLQIRKTCCLVGVVEDYEFIGLMRADAIRRATKMDDRKVEAGVKRRWRVGSRKGKRERDAVEKKKGSDRKGLVSEADDGGPSRE